MQPYDYKAKVNNIKILSCSTLYRYDILLYNTDSALQVPKLSMQRSLTATLSSIYICKYVHALYKICYIELFSIILFECILSNSSLHLFLHYLLCIAGPKVFHIKVPYCNTLSVLPDLINSINCIEFSSSLYIKSFS